MRSDCSKAAAAMGREKMVGGPFERDKRKRRLILQPSGLSGQEDDPLKKNTSEETSAAAKGEGREFFVHYFGD